MIRGGISIFCGIIMLVPAAYVHDTRDAEISRLTSEKQRKYAELEKCVKSVQGLQIAGISTLGLTAGGIALNISQADKRKNLDSQISATNSKIEKKKQEIEDKRIQEERERAERERQTQAKNTCESDGTKTYVNDQCVDKSSAETQQTESVTQDESVAKPSNTVDTNKVMGSESGCRALASAQNGTECYQDSDGEWKIRWAVKEGDPCPISDCFDQKNTATCKYVWVPESFVCVADTCKTGYKVFGHMCKIEKPVSCDETKGEIVSVSGEECLKCTEGHIAHNGRCQRCPYDKKPAGNECIDYTCGPSEFKTWGSCTKCQQNHIVENNRCVACPSTKKAENNRCVEFTCPSNMFKSYGECVACNGTSVTKNMIANADQTGCEQNYTSDALDEFRKGCRKIGGRMEAPTKCFLPKCDIGYSAIEKQCYDIGSNTGLPMYIGKDDGACYCEI